MSTTNRLQRVGSSDERPRLPQRLLRLRPLQPPLHSRTALRRRRGRQRLLPVGLPAPTALRCAGTRHRVSSGDGRQWTRLDDGRSAVVSITAAERSRHSWVDLVGGAVAAA